MQVSNKTLAMFLVAAIVVSIAGTLIGLNKIGSIGTTGYATGTANLTIYTNSSIRFAAGFEGANWGSGTITAGTNCSLETDGGNTGGCENFTTVSNDLVIENDGNTFLEVNLSANETAATLLPGCLEPPLFQFNATKNETTSCETGATDMNYNLTTWSQFNLNGSILCTNLSFEDTKDSIGLALNVTIPYTCTTGDKRALLTILGTDV